MSILWTPPKPERPQRGAAAVGLLAELPAQDRAAVLALRNWCSGPDGREVVACDFARALPAGRATQALNAFGDLMAVMLTAARRPLMRHGATCTCLGGDEAAFAHLIAAAAAGDHEDAMAFALILMQANAAWQAVQLARGVGLSLLQMTRVRPAAAGLRLN